METNDSILSEIKEPETEVSFFQGFFTRLIDFIIDLFFLVSIYLLIPRELLLRITQKGSFWGMAIILMVVLVYRARF